MASGWVQEASPHPGSRVRQLSVTQAGEDLLRSAVPAWRAAQRQAIRTLGRDAATIIAATTNRLMQESAP
jgi:DNA-binding MarR family transcriptional regulator